jgi:hypothetical protein
MSDKPRSYAGRIGRGVGLLLSFLIDLIPSETLRRKVRHSLWKTVDNLRKRVEKTSTVRLRRADQLENHA